ncbi:MAG: hypothetical protein EOP24_37485 [Hyphomicrobiales bacterium]|nr:MAG: hypothetical protein EOP24_37485 [Hyphomicrobiales bacterium]
MTEDAPSVPSDETIAERRRELAELEVNIARARVSEATGVPPHLLHGTTVQDFEKQAAELKQWSTRTWRPPTDIERVRRAFSKE